MKREEFDALMDGTAEAGPDLDLIAALGRVGRARRPGRAIATALAPDEERWDEDPVLLAAADLAIRAFPARYEAEGLVVELRLGLGGLPAAALLAGPETLEVELEGETVPLQRDSEALLPWVETPPDELRARLGDRVLVLRLV